jgi:DNA-binding XRE family transcriptional regulator
MRPYAGLGKRLKQAREERGLTISLAAWTIGVPVEQWEAWELGMYQPSFFNGLKAALLLAINPGWLSDGDGPKVKPPGPRPADHPSETR